MRSFISLVCKCILFRLRFLLHLRCLKDGVVAGQPKVSIMLVFLTNSPWEFFIDFWITAVN